MFGEKRAMCQGLLISTLSTGITRTLLCPHLFLCEHSDHNVLCVLDKKEDEKKKSDEDHEQVVETAVAMDNWQKIGAPVVVAVESS